MEQKYLDHSNYPSFNVPWVCYKLSSGMLSGSNLPSAADTQTVMNLYLLDSVIIRNRNIYTLPPSTNKCEFLS